MHDAIIYRGCGLPLQDSLIAPLPVLGRPTACKVFDLFKVQALARIRPIT